MKKSYLMTMMLVALGWYACQKEAPKQTGENHALELRNMCGTTSWNLTARQTLDVGTLTVSNDAENIYVTFTLDDPDYPNACFGIFAPVGGQ